MPARTGARHRLGSIRTSLVLLALVPSVTLGAVWGVTTIQILNEGLRLRSQTTVSESTGALGSDVTLDLQTERRLSAEWLASPGSSRTALDQQRQRTDTAIQELVRQSGALAQASSRIRDQMYPVTAAAQSLEYYRDQIDNPGEGNARQALDQYTAIVDSQINAFQELSQVDDGALTSEAQSLVSMEHAAELVSQEDALLTLNWPGGQLGSADYAKFAQLVGARRWLVDTQITPYLSGDVKVSVERITGSRDWREMQSVEDAVIAARSTDRRSPGATLPNMSQRWRSALDRLSVQWAGLVHQRTAVLFHHSSAKARSLLVEAGGVSVAGLAAVLLSVVLSTRITRSLSRRLRGLREATLRLATARLPDVVARLHRGERIDVAAETPPLDYGKDELGEMAEAFNTAQRTAVTTAVELAETRAGFQQVILGIARHTQNLVNRQLSTLDALEREHQDPVVLAGLYELDSTASQMRRYEENLVIISGGEPSRRWADPVAVVDVLRSAVGEVAEYQRIQVHADQEARLAAPAVADVIHLLAELIENAAVYSPAPSPVRVRADLVVKGLAVEVEDQGVGMSEEAYASLNRQLAEPPTLDVLALADGLQLGIFVIGRLAARHGIAVTLRPSPFGGTSAVVLIPERIVVRPSPHSASRGARTVTGPTASTASNELPAQTAGGALPRRPTSANRTATAEGPVAELAVAEADVSDAGSVPVLAPDLSGGADPGIDSAADPDAAPDADPGNAEPSPAPDPGPAVRGTARPQLVRATAPGGQVPGPGGSGSSNSRSPAVADPGSGHADGPVPLPRRVPQTSLAAELRCEAASAPVALEAADHPALSVGRSAAALSAFQIGTRQARDVQDAPGDAET